MKVGNFYAVRIRPHFRAIMFFGMLTLLVGAALRYEPACTGRMRLGNQVWEVERADTPEKRRLGLAGRSSLPKGQGMLFVFPVPEQATFWMHGMLFPLDIIFIQGGVVRAVERHISPQSTETFPSPGTVDEVLEVNAGEAERIGPGTVVTQEMFLMRF